MDGIVIIRARLSTTMQVCTGHRLVLVSLQAQHCLPSRPCTNLHNSTREICDKYEYSRRACVAESNRACRAACCCHWWEEQVKECMQSATDGDETATGGWLTKGEREHRPLDASKQCEYSDNMKTTIALYSQLKSPQTAASSARRSCDSMWSDSTGARAPHFYNWLSTGAPWVEEQQTRNWQNCTDHHESAHQND